MKAEGLIPLFLNGGCFSKGKGNGADPGFALDVCLKREEHGGEILVPLAYGDCSGLSCGVVVPGTH